jgi:cytochrome P450
MVDHSAQFPLGSQVQLEELARDPYPVLKMLQEQEPISWIRELHAWFVTRRADCITVLLDSSTFSVTSTASLLEDTLGQTMLSTDGGRQRQLRQHFNGPFSSKAVQVHMAIRIAAYARHLADTLLSSGHAGQADLKMSFADPLALWTVMTTLGLPIHDFPAIRGWFTDIAHALGNFSRDPLVRERGRTASAAFKEYAYPHLERLRRKPDDSILAQVAAAGDLSDEELLATASVIVFGGLETTAAMLSNTLWALLTHPEQLAAVRTHPHLLPQAIEEVLRWEPPVQSCTRFVTRPLILHGVELAPGEMVQCMVGAANRDPAHFTNPNPNLFDLGRSNAREHLSFAIGKHFCLGAALARLEGEIGLRILFERLPGLHLDPSLPSSPRGHEFRSPPALNVLYETV